MIEIMLTLLTSLIIALFSIVLKLAKEIGEIKGKIDMIIRFLNGKKNES